jgi:hypothetical protein
MNVRLEQFQRVIFIILTQKYVRIAERAPMRVRPKQYTPPDNSGETIFETQGIILLFSAFFMFRA